MDWTERKLAQREFARLSEQRRIALDSAQLGWWHHDFVTSQGEWDERAREFYDAPTCHFVLTDVLASILPEDLANRERALQAALQSDSPQPYFIEYRVRQRDGSVRWLQVKGQANFTGQGTE